jgi:hypothetical protein
MKSTQFLCLILIRYLFIPVLYSYYIYIIRLKTIKVGEMILFYPHIPIRCHWNPSKGSSGRSPLIDAVQTSATTATRRGAARTSAAICQGRTIMVNI